MLPSTKLFVSFTAGLAVFCFIVMRGVSKRSPDDVVQRLVRYGLFSVITCAVVAYFAGFPSLSLWLRGTAAISIFFGLPFSIAGLVIVMLARTRANPLFQYVTSVVAGELSVVPALYAAQWFVSPSW
jgi:hypothetical protein